jgi:hypothetical protein
VLWPWGQLSLWQTWVPGVFPGGKCGQCVRLTTLPPSCAIVKKSGNLNFLEPSGPPQAWNGTALPLLLWQSGTIVIGLAAPCLAVACIGVILIVVQRRNKIECSWFYILLISQNCNQLSDDVFVDWNHYIIHMKQYSFVYSGLVVRVSGYRYRGPGFDPRRYQILWVVVGLERGPFSLVRSLEELLE